MIKQGRRATATHALAFLIDLPRNLPADVARLLAAADPTERDDAWAAFVHAHTDLLLRVARSLGGGQDAAMDRYAYVLEQLRQDDCGRLRAYARPGAGDFSLWLVVVVRRLCVDHYRHQYGRARAGDGSDNSHDDRRKSRRRLVDLVADQVDVATVAGPTTGAPDQVLACAERTRAIVAALDQLAPRDRLLLRLRFVEELPVREIAGLMAFPTVFHGYRRLQVVLRALRASLERAGVEDAEP
jgi:RNA polymerase sigma factor (sigma-70 family)